jgi:hypothetical protein
MDTQNKSCNLSLENMVIDISDPRSVFKLHRDVNIYKWANAVEKILELINTYEILEMLKNTIQLPKVGSYEYVFDVVYKYPENALFDYVMPVDVMYKQQTIILVGVKDDDYYKVIVEKNDFKNPIVYKMNVEDYVYV